MKPITAEWVAKAEGDFATMERESRVKKNPNFDGICFHAQQCAEKYLKSRLCESGISFSKIHDLTILLDQTVEIEPEWEVFREGLAYITDFAINYRYPGESADKNNAMKAHDYCRDFRRAARKSLGLTPD